MYYHRPGCSLCWLRYLYILACSITTRRLRLDQSDFHLPDRASRRIQVLVSLVLLWSTPVNLLRYGNCRVWGRLRLDQFAFMPSMSMGMAVSALVGQNLGAGKPERVSETVKWGAILASSITVIVSIVAIVRPRILMVLFTQDEAVLVEGSRYLRYVALSYIPMALMFTIGGVIRGAGDTVATMYLTLGSLWIVRVPLARYLSSLPQLGVAGVWLAMALGTCIGFVFHLLYYRSGRWKEKVVVQKAAEGS